MVQPVLEWCRGAMRRDLRLGTYAFGGATPGDQRVLAALGAGRRPAASLKKMTNVFELSKVRASSAVQEA